MALENLLKTDNSLFFLKEIFSYFLFGVLKPATHLAISYADRGEFDRQSPPINADTLGDFFRRSQRCGSFEKSCDKIAQSDE